MKFSQTTKDKLGYYVYGLVDPRTDLIFYVGKASANNRAFDHLKASKQESAKANLIKEIKLSDLEPRIEILRYGLDSEQLAFEIEAAIIDALGLENLTNAVRGHGISKGRLLAKEAERLYGSSPQKVSEISNPVMLFFIHNTYSPTLNEQELYDCTRQFWHSVSEYNRNRSDLKIALAVVDSVVVRAYTIEAWFPAGTTFSSRKLQENRRNRWEFVGNVVTDSDLLGRQLINDDGTPFPASQIGYGYLPRT